MSLDGHFWTLTEHLRRSWRAATPPLVPEPWATVVEDPVVGPVPLSGWLSVPVDARALVIVVHGLGGSAESAYVREAASVVERAGLACLRLNLRGADGGGADIYHAGLTADVAAAVDSLAARRFDRIGLLGFSLGGHVVLRSAIERASPALGAVAAICPPLDLAAAARAIDRPLMWPYRRYLLRRLKAIHRATSRCGSPPSVRLERVEGARTFVEFDSLVIAPRFGFADAWDYYERMSVGPLLPTLDVSGMLIYAPHDPMIPAASVEPLLEGAPTHLECYRIEPGGHLGFPPHTDLGLDRPAGIYSQVVGWLESRLAPARRFGPD